jgi:carbon-monoxide dehydrogenase large subunit
MPFKTGLVFTYDSGEFEKNMEAVLAMADWAGFEARRAVALPKGKLRGIGIASVIEIAGGPADRPMEEGAEIRFDPGGNVLVLVGSHSHGQGLETAFAQVVNHALGVPPERVRVVYGDTDQVYHGKGTFGSRSATVGSMALVHAAARIVDKAKAIAAHLLEASPLDIEFAEGSFTVAGTDRTIALGEVAKASFMPARLPPGMDLGLSGAAIVAPDKATFPNGCHVSEVEIDRDTGKVAVTGYWVVDDVGRMLNPMLVKGQIHGGIAQGLGQALLEEVVYDRDGGQLLSGSFMDYAMPRASDIPDIEAAANEVLTASNPLGVKGAGEAGAVGALPAIMNAIADALAPLGIDHLDMPATPERVWRAIQSAQR